MAIEGIDVSHWNATVDWGQVKADGYVFAMAKATEGLTYIDPMFQRNYAEMKRVGLIYTAYHFAHPESDAKAQAEHFYSVAKGSALPLVLDIEGNFGRTAAQVSTWIGEFVAALEKLDGRKPIIYSGGFWRGGSAGHNTFGCKLWLAEYGPEPKVPAEFGTHTFWQYTDGVYNTRGKTTVPGVPGHCDRNEFNGSLAQLQELAGQKAAPEKGWDEVATKQEIRDVVQAEIYQALHKLARALVDATATSPAPPAKP